MRILVCGGRAFEDEDFLYNYLDDYFTRNNLWYKAILIQGGAIGADLMAARWALSREQACCQVNALWEKLGRSAGILRNGWMLRLKPDVVIAFPGGRGTEHMCRISEEAGIPVEKPMPGY